jgi:hypothetical protein
MFLFTAFDLEAALVQAVRSWVSDPPILLRDPYNPTNTAGVVPIVYQGRVPSAMTPGSPALESNFPYKAPSITISAGRKDYRRKGGIAVVNMLIITFDDDLARNGYVDVENICQRIIYGIYEAGIIAAAFPLLDDLVHAETINDPSIDYFGYFLGRIEAKFGIYTPQPMEDQYPLASQDVVLTTPASGTVPKRS